MASQTANRMAVAALLLLIVGVIVYDHIRQRPQPLQLTYAIFIARHYFTGPVRVSANGKELGTFSEGQEQTWVTLPEAAGPPRLSATGLFPCGWKSLVTETQPDGYARLILAIRTTPRMEVLVDNRGRPAGELRIGQRTLPLPADAPAVGAIEPPDCPEADSAVLAGASFGPLSAPGGQPRNVLIDPSASRCYQVSPRVYYRDYIPERQPVPGLISAHLSPPAAIHEVPVGVSYFLEEPPGQIQGSISQEYEVRYWVAEEPCRRTNH